MSEDTTVDLVSHLEEFSKERIGQEQKYIALRNAIKEGIESGVATDFDSEKHLTLLKGNRVKNV